MPSILDTIVEYKVTKVGERKKDCSLKTIKEIASEQEPARGFFKALSDNNAARRPAVIAECKKGSPSKGVIVPDYKAETIAATYEKAGATCLSVLTDTKFFHGANNDLIAVKKSCALPILRKDFIIDSYQIYETRAIGADCILLIVSCLTDQQLDEFFHTSIDIGLDVLIEVHDRIELERALRLRSPLIGINNRNLKIFETDILNTVTLMKDIPDDRVIVSESGISTRKDVEILKNCGINAFLIGETFLRSSNPFEKIRELFPELK